MECDRTGDLFSLTDEETVSEDTDGGEDVFEEIRRTADCGVKAHEDRRRLVCGGAMTPEGPYSGQWATPHWIVSTVVGGTVVYVTLPNGVQAADGLKHLCIGILRL